MRDTRRRSANQSRFYNQESKVPGLERNFLNLPHSISHLFAVTLLLSPLSHRLGVPPRPGQERRRLGQQLDH